MEINTLWVVLQILGYGAIALTSVAGAMALYDLIRGAPYLDDEPTDADR